MPAGLRGAARGLFNAASAVEDLALALDLAARASIALEGGGMAAAQAFLGLVDDLAAQPASWKAARPGASWRERLFWRWGRCWHRSSGQKKRKISRFSGKNTVMAHFLACGLP